MFLFYVSIPLMVLAVAVAVVPLLSAIRRQERQHRFEAGRARVATVEGLPARSELPAAA